MQFVTYSSLLALFTLLCCGERAGVNAQLPPGFVQVGLGDAGTGDNLLDITFLPSGYALLVGRTGLIKIGNMDVENFQTNDYLDLRNLSFSEGETGAFDLELDPSFATSPYIYVVYQRNNISGPRPSDAGSSTRISRFTHVENGMNSTALLSSERVLWRANTGYPLAEDGFTYPHHYGGGLAFGPDGLLYMAYGDQASDPLAGKLNPAQLAAKDSGCVIRITKTGAYPAGNLARGCFVKGVRNGFKASWDFQSGMFFIGDVGSNQCLSYEEINVLTLKSTKTSNFGWPLCEGYCGNPMYPDCACANRTLLEPWYSYLRPNCEVGAAVVGGMRYRAKSFPPSYHGAYFFADYGLNHIAYLHVNANNKPVLPAYIFAAADAIVCMTISPTGDLFYGDWFGHVGKISYNPEIITEPSCENYGCGNTGEACACDEACLEIGDCCADYLSFCVITTPTAAESTTAVPPTFPPTGTVLETNWDIFISTPSSPLRFTLVAGDAIQFKYTDAMQHTVQDKATGVLLCGLHTQPFSCVVPFLSAGNYTIVCSLHPSMFALITVQEPPAKAMLDTTSSRDTPTPFKSTTATIAPTTTTLTRSSSTTIATTKALNSVKTTKILPTTKPTTTSKPSVKTFPPTTKSTTRASSTTTTSKKVTVASTQKKATTTKVTGSAATTKKTLTTKTTARKTSTTAKKTSPKPPTTTKKAV